MARDRCKRSGRRSGSFRYCTGCHRRLPRESAVRLVRGLDGNLLPDLSGKLPGRGIHFCPDITCFQKARASKSLFRAFQAPTLFGDPFELANIFLNSHFNQVRVLLGTALRAGWIHTGRTAVNEAMRNKQVALVLLAENASPSLRREMKGHAETLHIPCETVWNTAEFSKFHRGKPLAVLGVQHRGIARRLRNRLASIVTLAASIRLWKEQPDSRLTARLVRGKMLERCTGSSLNRS